MFRVFFAISLFTDIYKKREHHLSKLIPLVLPGALWTRYEVYLQKQNIWVFCLQYIETDINLMVVWLCVCVCVCGLEIQHWLK